MTTSGRGAKFIPKLKPDSFFREGEGLPMILAKIAIAFVERGLAFTSGYGRGSCDRDF